jgi:hypothetical protein
MEVLETYTSALAVVSAALLLVAAGVAKKQLSALGQSVWIDYQMPRLSGIDAGLQLRKLQPALRSNSAVRE